MPQLYQLLFQYVVPVLYHIAIAAMENVNNYWKLNASESLEMSKDLLAEERKKIFDSFINNQEINGRLVRDG
jgi:hypothetical protein